MTTHIRVLRLLEYVGPAEWVHNQINRRTVKGSMKIDHQDASIHEALLGEYGIPVILVPKPEELPGQYGEFMKFRGWDFVPTGPNEWEWKLFSPEGAILATQGDSTWAHDLGLFAKSQGEM